MGMLLRVHVISGSGYDSTTHTNLATSSTSASTVSRGVLIKGAAQRRRKYENLPVTPEGGGQGRGVPAGHQMAPCFMQPSHVCCD